MIEHSEIEGRPAIVAYLKDGMQPCEPDEATKAKIIFKDNHEVRWVRFTDTEPSE